MSSISEDYDDFDEDVLDNSSSQQSQDLPAPAKAGRSAKRRRTSDNFIDDDSADDFIDDDDGGIIQRNKRRRLSVEEESGEEDREGKPVSRKKSKHKIHIPKDGALPATTIQYGTQISVELDSSPSRIRGPMWRRPKKSVASIPAHESTLLKRNTAPVPSVRDTISSLPAPSLGPSAFDAAQELADLPSDAFSSSPEARLLLENPLPDPIIQPKQRLIGPKNGLHQTTLFGGRAATEELIPSQVNKVHNYKVDMATESPTHHKLDDDAMKTWVYPTNLGTTRDYQFNIARQGLFSNMLVALPTGLGKTFIAATIMLNYFRWTKDAKIVFMAPTKPLVAQQVDACFNIAGIPRSVTTMLTGEINPATRAEEWAQKRVFFMTPQTLDNDLRTGIADPKKIVLLVVDEAHRATGNYSYVKVVSFLRRFSKSFRILALTATPGSSVEAVQEVIDGLEISKVEIRTEDSMDIQQFTHRRKIEQILLDPSDEMIMVKDLLSKTLKPLVDQLCGQNAYWNKDPMSLTPFGLMQAQKSWLTSGAGRRANPGLKGMMRGLFSILAGVAHSIKLLNFHGIGPFFANLKDFRTGVEEDGKKAGKYRKQINDSPHFKKMMDQIQAWINKGDFVGHPKLTYLCDTILNHFLDAGEGRLADGAPHSGTRVIVFAEFRDSAEEICRVLNRHGPMIRASVFVGQADSRRSEGMNQKKQLETISKFKSGCFNVIVATSIGEEGLDIGQVDLIVCYDASGSPIRMLQRMGRTGRKRAGNIVLLLMRGKEEESFAKAKDNYEQMQKMIASGTRFNFRHDLSTRIIPPDVSPQVDKRDVEIPVENTQDQSLPEPKRRTAKTKKMPPKKFHMPDGVETGFSRASKLIKGGDESGEDGGFSSASPERELSEVPAIESVLLSSTDLKDLERSYQNVSGDGLQEVTLPEMTSHPEFQRTLAPYKFVHHGLATTRFVEMIGAMLRMDGSIMERWRQIYDEGGVIDEPRILDGDIASVCPQGLRDSSSRPLDTFQSNAKRHLKQPYGIRKMTRKRASESLSDASRNGFSSDEEDFVVRDTEPFRGTISSSTRSSSPPELLPPPHAKPFFEPTQFAATQETNDEDAMPEINDLLGNKSSRPMRSPLAPKRTENSLGPRPDRRWKRRRIVEEGESEE